MATLVKRTGNAPPIPNEAQQSFVQYASEVMRVANNNYNMRERMQQIDRLYQRETDYTTAHARARRANMTGDSSKMQNIVLPVVMPQVESLLSELSNIFLASYPLFPVFSKPEMQAAAMQMEAVIGEQGVQFGWAAELLQAMRDGLKYNLMAVEVAWENKKVYAVTNDATQSITTGVATETLFVGNSIKRRDPYNLFMDTMVPPFEIHTRGEYVGYTEIISRMELKMRFAEMDPTRTMNARDAFESGMGSVAVAAQTEGYFIPQVNPFALVDPNQNTPGGVMNWHAWAGLEGAKAISYSNAYEFSVIYARILPSEHKIYGKNSNTPQIWKMIIINRRVCVYAERMSNAHNYLPIIVAQAHEDGLSWQSKSFADNAGPFQSLASALYNSGIESQRRKVYDRIFYDPSRINKADIDNTSVVARIPVKQESYGKAVTDAFAVSPYRDDNVAQIFATAEQVLNIADIANGQNRVQRGQFQKGNKTRKEFDTTMEASNARPQMVALVLENRFFTPIKQILKLNTLQYQPSTTVFDRKTNKAPIQIDPTKLREAALEFKVADGVMPTDSYVNMELFQVMLQTAAMYPPIISQWDIVGMIFYWLSLEGATWINDFKIQQPTNTTPGVPPNAPPQPQPGAAAALN